MALVVAQDATTTPALLVPVKRATFPLTNSWFVWASPNIWRRMLCFLTPPQFRFLCTNFGSCFLDIRRVVSDHWRSSQITSLRWWALGNDISHFIHCSCVARVGHVCRVCCSGVPVSVAPPIPPRLAMIVVAPATVARIPSVPVVAPPLLVMRCRLHRDLRSTGRVLHICAR